MHCASGLLHNLTAPPLIGPLTVRFTSPEDGRITGLHYHHLPQGSLVSRSSTSNVWPQGSKEGRGTWLWSVNRHGRYGEKNCEIQVELCEAAGSSPWRRWAIGLGSPNCLQLSHLAGATHWLNLQPPLASHQHLKATSPFFSVSFLWNLHSNRRCWAQTLSLACKLTILFSGTTLSHTILS